MRSTRVVMLLIALLLLVSAAAVVPLPFFLERPGTAVGLGQRVAIEAPGAGPIDGDFMLTTVYLTQTTALELVLAWADDEVRVVPLHSVLPPGQSEAEFFARQQDLFTESAQRAAAVGLRAAGFDVGPEDLGGDGALVVETFPGSAAEGRLLPGDVVVHVGGTGADRQVRTYDDLLAALRVSGGEPLRLTIRRGGRTRELEITPRPVPGVSDEPVIGIQVSTLNATVDLPVPVDVDSGQIGGLSAGLMIALTVFDKIDPVDLADGRRIAGTGTIGFDGEIGPIGGIEQKVVAAHREQVDVFLVPDEQLVEARSGLPEDSAMEVMGVGTFDEALSALS